MTERIFQSEALTNGWANITNDGVKTYWFDTDQVFPKIYSLDKAGIPAYWDDVPYSEEIIKECTHDDVCCLILSSGKTKVLVVVHASLPHVAMHGRATKEIPWAEYTTEGFWSIKKHIGPYQLDAAVINPTMETLEKLGVLKSIIQKFVKDAKLIEGGADESPADADGTDQDGAEE
ncbi:hypothetical protein SAMN02745216_05086 [Desulfatibacillum alkenivorans DSM 16219]|jgi:hypothetical protein|uniref:Uncharacterized protein n=2 Tax=Desulfatibacillum alkenivorans DSM 16219 TaxID=1121393 RepID=A0A1M7A331_9BACT|nr:hypothetical protein [Desulfatibacillum alkenivorans]SHL37086.1 hypothetical protein SAMN02745216_05086 [Desulfatibacillum alkenivorans DSM 16219]